MQRREDLLTVIAFALALALPLAGTRWHPDPALVGPENRKLAPRPAPLAHTKLEPWLRACEAFMGDHFGGRDTCITLYNRIYHGLFATSGTPRVLVGTDGWLYFAGQGSIESARGALRDTDPVVEQWVTLLTDRRDWLAERGTRFVVMVAPDKHTIHPEHLPPRVRRVSSANRLDAVLAALARRGVETVDVRPALRAALKNGPLYLRSDSHWTERGAAIAAQVVAEKLGWPFTPRRFGPVALSGGDLADMLAMRPYFPDAGERADPPVPSFAEAVKAAPSRTGPRALVMHDSFGTFLCFLDRVAFTALDGYQLEAHEVERVQPPVVVQELVERRFNEAPWSGAPEFSADRTVRRAFERAPKRERRQTLPPFDLPAGQYGVLRVETRRVEPGLAVLAGQTAAGRVATDRRAPGGRGVVYLVAGGPEPVRGLTLSFLGHGETQVGALELATGLTPADLTPAGVLARPLTYFGQELAWQGPATAAPGAAFTGRVAARNPGLAPWLPGGPFGTRLRATWLANGRPVDGGQAHPLPAVGGGVTQLVDLALTAPRAPGRYVLRLTVEQEPDLAFTDQGGRPCDATIDVR